MAAEFCNAAPRAPVWVSNERSRSRWLASNSKLNANTGNTAIHSQRNHLYNSEIIEQLDPIQTLEISSLDDTSCLQHLEILTQTTSGVTRIIVPFLARTDHSQFLKKKELEDNGPVLVINTSDQNLMQIECPEINCMQSSDTLTSVPIKKVNQLTANIIKPTTIGLNTCVLNRTVSGNFPMGNDSQQHSGIMAFDTVEECKLFETENIFGDSDILNFIYEQSNNNTPSSTDITVNNPATESTIISTTTIPTTTGKMFDQVKYEETSIFDDDYLNASQVKNIDIDELDIFNGEPILIPEPNEQDHNYCSIITNANDDEDIFNNNVNYYDVREINKALLGNPMLGTGIPLSQTSLDIKPITLSNIKLPSSQNSIDFTTFKQSLSQESTINLAEYTSIDNIIKTDIDFDTITNNNTASSQQQQINNNNNTKIQQNETTTNYETPKDNISASSKRKLPKLKIQLGKNISIIPPDYISTPDVCENVLSLEEDKIKYEYMTTRPSTNDQRSQTPSIIDVGSEYYSPSSVHDNPPSVQSYISDDFTTSSNISTAPPTPRSYSTISSTSDISPQQQRQQKKPRGRPPKKHSTQPDPDELRNLSEKERRYREQRYKNNEASRQSRLNRKRKEDLDKQELDREEDRNRRLRARISKLKSDEVTLKETLKRILDI